MRAPATSSASVLWVLRGAATANLHAGVSTKRSGPEASAANSRARSRAVELWFSARFQQPGGVTRHQIDFQIERVGFAAGTEGGRFERMRNDENTKNVALDRIDGER